MQCYHDSKGCGCDIKKKGLDLFFFGRAILRKKAPE